MSTLEPPADTSWMRMETLSGKSLNWRASAIDKDGIRHPGYQHDFRSRRAAERYARKHTCEHYHYEVYQLSPCGHEETRP